MNVENVNAVADAIEQHTIEGLGFNMMAFVQLTWDGHAPDNSGHSCGTTACIGGWAAAVARSESPAGLLSMDRDPSISLADVGRDFLGITENQENELFYACPNNTPFGKTSSAQAVKVLRHLAATGEVDWSVAE